MTIRDLNLTRQVHTLKSALRESQDASDTMELEKAALEEAFKRTIKVNSCCQSEGGRSQNLSFKPRERLDESRCNEAGASRE